MGRPNLMQPMCMTPRMTGFPQLPGMMTSMTPLWQQQAAMMALWQQQQAAMLAAALQQQNAIRAAAFQQQNPGLRAIGVR
jgi:hypothetical protein